jgi:hypothetical protein
MKKDNGFKTISDVFKNKPQIKTPKSPAYQWQDMALKIIADLDIPLNKKSSVFKACRDNNKIFIERCVTDTKELCKKGEQWRYFFKVLKK